MQRNEVIESTGNLHILPKWSHVVHRHIRSLGSSSAMRAAKVYLAVVHLQHERMKGQALKGEREMSPECVPKL